ncbi:MAG: phospholipid/cholesterol/gamma-HCH transport system permease protein, partial [Congregibacter sp.]
LLHLQRRAFAEQRDIEYLGAPDTQTQLMKLATAVAPYAGTATTSSGIFSLKNLRTTLAEIGDDLLESLEFLGATVNAVFRTLLGRSGMRRREFIESLAQAGPQAIGIITLTSVLVGMILAYLGAAQLQQFGAAVFVADLVAIGMLREMGALMTAIVMAGRTGAAYAAQLSTMQSNEEIDAISTLGINPLDFLVVPRVLALILMMPLLVIYADALGIVGGAVVAGSMGVTPLQYASQLGTAITMTHFLVGIVKGLIFAALIATAGCRAGMNAGRNSEAVGRATTEAVVTAVVYLIVADAAINILCQLLGI